MQRFRQMLAPAQQVELVRLAESHRGIPDVELLRRLLGPDTVLLTTDRVLHNQVCDLGFCSYTLDQQGNLRRKKLPRIRAPKPVASASRGELKLDYVHPSHPLARALKQGMTEKAFERYRTRRRRIRSYFGSEANIASAALTIGAKGTAKGWLCGYYLRLAGKSGVKGLQASEGYSNSPAPEARPAWCVIHAPARAVPAPVGDCSHADLHHPACVACALRALVEASGRRRNDNRRQGPSPAAEGSGSGAGLPLCERTVLRAHGTEAPTTGPLPKQRIGRHRLRRNHQRTRWPRSFVRVSALMDRRACFRRQ